MGLYTLTRDDATQQWHLDSGEFDDTTGACQLEGSKSLCGMVAYNSDAPVGFSSTFAITAKAACIGLGQNVCPACVAVLYSDKATPVPQSA